MLHRVEMRKEGKKIANISLCDFYYVISQPFQLYIFQNEKKINGIFIVFLNGWI